MATPLPLQGIRVINFGWVWAGPVVGQTLGFLGAEVLKIESRARIDMTRNLPPFAEGIVDPNRGLSNHACGAGNGSVTLDLKQPEGRALALRLPRSMWPVPPIAPPRAPSSSPSFSSAMRSRLAPKVFLTSHERPARTSFA